MRAIAAISCAVVFAVGLPNAQWEAQSVPEGVSPYGVHSCIPFLPWFCEKTIPVSD